MNVTALMNAFEELATLLEIDGANAFKVRAFRNATRVLRDHSHQLEALAKSDELTSLPGVGPGIATKVREFANTGTMQELEELRARIPPGVLAMTQIPSLGARKASVIHKELGIDSIEKLKAACEAGTLAQLKGMSAKTCAKILEGIAQAESFRGRLRLDEGWALAQPILEKLRDYPGVKRADVAGSLRRWKETVGDLDFVASTSAPREVMDFFVTLPDVTSILGNGDKKASVIIAGKVQADVRCVTEAEYPYAMMHFTGSKEHNTKLRTRAKDFGLKLNEYGLFREGTGERIPAGDEREIHSHLKLQYMPPETREDHGEIELAATGSLPVPFARSSLRGLLHMHTTYSDGKPSLEDYARWAHSNGIEWMGIADHSKSLVIAHGMKEDEVARQHAEINALNKQYARRGVRLLKGIESDILPDGSLDYPDHVLASFDFIVASVHSNFAMTEKEQTARICRAIENPHTTVLGHMTGRQLLIRDGYHVDQKAVIRCAAENRVAIEINGNPRRLDMDWRLIRFALDLGCKLTIGPDAHSLSGLNDAEYAMAMLRKAWATSSDVLNCLGVDEFLAHAAARRGGAPS
ncbi:DNA polymerase/3'-5' exonuclease PolX [Candidatus Sumerlaeota bacterium]|nr:DNA polymerase/3'-5' exonuclease PolX [Candidatus Sumerlaeota bacterium]